MILQHILFKNFILKTIKNKVHIIDFILLLKQIVILYTIFYTQATYNTQWLAINHFTPLSTNLKIFNFFTNIPYINNKKIDTFINNWQVLRKQLLLLKWVIYLIYLINKHQLKLPVSNIIKLFKKFIILKKNYWNIINLKNPTYILIISKDFQNSLCKKYIKLAKQVFFLISGTNSTYYNPSIIIIPNLPCMRLLLELIITAHMQGKYFLLKKRSKEN